MSKAEELINEVIEMKFASPEALWNRSTAEMRIDRLGAGGLHFEPEDIKKKWKDLPDKIKKALGGK